jgi:hypothetical protein
VLMGQHLPGLRDQHHISADDGSLGSWLEGDAILSKLAAMLKPANLVIKPSVS